MTSTLIPTIKYNFDSWTLGSTSITNEGSSGSSNNAVLQNNAIVISSDYAVGGQCLQTGNQGTSYNYSYLSISGAVNLTNSFTICFWNKYPGTWNTNDVLFSFADATSLNYFRVGITTPSYLTFVSNDGHGMVTVPFTTTNTISAYTWHHYAIVCDSTNSLLLLYIDGSLVSSNAYIGYNITNNTINTVGYSPQGCMFLYDDFRVYSSALQLSDIQRLKNLYSNPGVYVPAIQYSFDQWISGNTVINEGYLGSVMNATLHNSATISTSSPPTGIQYLSLSSVNSQYMSIDNGLTLSGNDWAVCFWYNKSPSTTSETDVRIFDITTQLNTTSLEIAVGFNSSGSLYFLMNGNIVQTLCSTNCCDNIWRHVAIVYNSSSGKYSFYFNGVMCCNSISSSGTGNNLRSVFYIGRSVCTSNTYQYATVLIDDFRIYDNIALTLTNIALICGNCHYYNYQTSTSSYVLINSFFDSYIPNTSLAITTGYVTRIGNIDVDLNTLYRYNINSTSLTTSNKIYIPFKPNLIQGCCNYFSADINDGGIVLNNGNVQTWKDLSGCGNDAVQATTSYQPPYTSNDTYMTSSGMKLNQCLFFNGSQSTGPMLACPSGGFSSYAATVCFVMYPIQGTTSGAPTLFSSPDWTNGTIRMLWLMNILYLYIYSYPNAEIHSIFGSGQPCILITTWVNNGNTCTIQVYKNGPVSPIVQTPITVYASPINLTQLFIGRYVYQGNTSFWGGISSMIVYNRALTSDEVHQVEGYLAWKWWGSGKKILTNTNHPYYNSPPTVPPNDIGYVFNTKSVS